MFSGVLALTYRSLRIDSRSLVVHLSRFGLVFAIYVSLIVARRQSINFGAPGTHFLRSIAYLNLVFMSLLGISFFSTAVSEEKEEQTLGLMLMAGIRPLGILIGKSLGRILQAVVLVAVQYPFTLLAITLGGVSADQVNAVYLALGAYLVLLAGFGLLCSTIGSNSLIAATCMVLGLAVYTLVPLLTDSILSKGEMRFAVGHRGMFLADKIVSFSVFQQMGHILTTGFGDPLFSWQVISNTCVGIVCFGLAWGLFGYSTRDPSSEAVTREFVPTSGAKQRLFAPARAWDIPFVWKDFYFVAGGFHMILVRLLFCLGLWVLIVVVNRSNDAITGYQVFLSLAIAIDAGRVLAGSLYAELRGQTLASLVMLPRSTISIIYSKFAGAMLGWLPAALVNLLVGLGTESGQTNLQWMLQPEGFYITSFFVLIPNLSLILALYLRWGAVLLGTGLGIGLFFAVIPTLGPGPPGNFEAIIVGTMITAVSISFHFVAMRKIQLLASR